MELQLEKGGKMTDSESLIVKTSPEPGPENGALYCHRFNPERKSDPEYEKKYKIRLEQERKKKIKEYRAAQAELSTAKLQQEKKQAKDSNLKQSKSEDQIRQTEQEIMDQHHEPTVKLLEDLLNNLPNLHSGRVLDVGCGIGNLTKDCLIKHFGVVDMFDKDEKCIDAAKKLKQKLSAEPCLCDRPNCDHFAIDRVEVADMKDFKSEEKYKAIVMRWTTGYLKNDDLVSQLKVWRSWLEDHDKELVDPCEKNSYLLVLENIISED